MQPIIYDVAVSMDGYICGVDGDISKFAKEGLVVDDYMNRLQTYAVAIMGRSTYEFGYRFGMKPGQNPYENMESYVFSRKLECPADSDVTIVRSSIDKILPGLKLSSQGPIYLCGGGEFAGSLLLAGMIDVLRLKRAPVVLGNGVRLFGQSQASPMLFCTSTKTYDGGYVYQEFRLKQEIQTNA